MAMQRRDMTFQQQIKLLAEQFGNSNSDGDQRKYREI